LRRVRRPKALRVVSFASLEESASGEKDKWSSVSDLSSLCNRQLFSDTLIASQLLKQTMFRDHVSSGLIYGTNCLDPPPAFVETPGNAGESSKDDHPTGLEAILRNGSYSRLARKSSVPTTLAYTPLKAARNAAWTCLAEIVSLPKERALVAQASCKTVH
jgi:hypothetical protein